jgi:hypothetical protein
MGHDKKWRDGAVDERIENASTRMNGKVEVDCGCVQLNEKRC